MEALVSRTVLNFLNELFGSDWRRAKLKIASDDDTHIGISVSVSNLKKLGPKYINNHSIHTKTAPAKFCSVLAQLFLAESSSSICSKRFSLSLHLTLNLLSSDVYYCYKSLMGTQKASDAVIASIYAALGIPRIRQKIVRCHM